MIIKLAQRVFLLVAILSVLAKGQGKNNSRMIYQETWI